MKASVKPAFKNQNDLLVDSTHSYSELDELELE